MKALTLSRSLKQFLANAAILLGACDTDIAAPGRDLSSSPQEARAPAASLSTWPATDTRISLSWVDDRRSETGWEVHRSTSGATDGFAVLASLTANATSYTDTALAARTQYCYKVRSFHKQGSNPSYAAFTNVSCSATLGPPAAPSVVGAVPRNSRNIDVTWGDVSSDEHGFQIERAVDPAGPWITVATVGPNTSFFADGNGIWPDRHICYRVIATNPYGATASTPDCTAPPIGPADIHSTSSNAQSIDLTWVDASSVEDGYEVQRAALPGGWQVIANLAANTTSLHDAGIVTETSYQYRVRAKRDGGFSDFGYSEPIVAASRPPDAPVLRYVSPSGSTGAHVSWQEESALATEFRVERSQDGLSGWLIAATVRPGNGGAYLDGLSPEQQVCYRVVAHNAAGDSPASNVDCTLPPAGPTNLVITPLEGGGALVTWNDNSNIEEGYVVATYFCSPGGGCSYSTETSYAPNTTSIYLGVDVYGRDEYIEYLCAVYDGGCSDALSGWQASNGLASSGTGAVRPANRAPRPRPLMRPRRPRVPDSLVSPRKSP